MLEKRNDSKALDLNTPNREDRGSDYEGELDAT
jgi:hypothetical protein